MMNRARTMPNASRIERKKIGKVERIFEMKNLDLKK
jgi:hypothetical protein